MSLGFHSGKWRGTELIAEDNLFSFILGASQGAPRKRERSANMCEGVETSVSFPEESVPLEGRDAVLEC